MHADSKGIVASVGRQTEYKGMAFIYLDTQTQTQNSSLSPYTGPPVF